MTRRGSRWVMDHLLFSSVRRVRRRERDQRLRGWRGNAMNAGGNHILFLWEQNERSMMMRTTEKTVELIHLHHLWRETPSWSLFTNECNGSKAGKERRGFYLRSSFKGNADERRVELREEEKWSRRGGKRNDDHTRQTIQNILQYHCLCLPAFLSVIFLSITSLLFEVWISFFLWDHISHLQQHSFVLYRDFSCNPINETRDAFQFSKHDDSWHERQDRKENVTHGFICSILARNVTNTVLKDGTRGRRIHLQQRSGNRNKWVEKTLENIPYFISCMKRMLINLKTSSSTRFYKITRDNTDFRRVSNTKSIKIFLLFVISWYFWSSLSLSLFRFVPQVFSCLQQKFSLSSHLHKKSIGDFLLLKIDWASLSRMCVYFAHSSVMSLINWFHNDLNKKAQALLNKLLSYPTSGTNSWKEQSIMSLMLGWKGDEEDELFFTQLNLLRDSQHFLTWNPLKVIPVN